jgi:hypothetical protein
LPFIFIMLELLALNELGILPVLLQG